MSSSFPAFRDLVTPQYPRIVAWISTLACNLQCVHCYPRAGKVETRELTTEESKACITEFASLGVKSIFMSGGEPLLKGDLLELVKHSQDEGIMMFLCTNATLLSEKRGIQLKEAGLQGVFVGLEGASPEVVDKFSGVEGTLEAKIEGIRGSIKAGLLTSVDFVCTAYNYHELEPLIHLARTLKIQGFSLKRFVPAGRGKEHMSDLWVEPAQYQEVINTYCSHVLTSDSINFSAHEPLVTGRLTEIKKKTGYLTTCQVGIWCGINHSGDVLPCPMMPITLGNLRDETLADIWQNSPIIAHLKDKNLLKGQCGACELRYSCGGCRASAYAVSGDYLAEDIQCWKVKKGRSE